MPQHPSEQRDRNVSVADRDNTTPIVATVLGVLAALFLAWLFLFSGILGNSDNDVDGDRTQNIDVDVEREDQGEGADTDVDTDTDTDDS